MTASGGKQTKSIFGKSTLAIEQIVSGRVMVVHRQLPLLMDQNWHFCSMNKP